jgi:uncharacterized protein
MATWFELSKSKDGRFRFVLKAANAETILTSELYKSKGSAEKGIASVQSNCGSDERYEKKVAISKPSAHPDSAASGLSLHMFIAS